jgi:hypothetical protein
VFFGQHSARCIPPGYPGAGNFTVFNNTPPGATSSVWEFTPPMDVAGNFILAPGTAYGPSGPVWTFSHPLVQSNFMSSAERLPNGNTLICSALQGAVFEVAPAGSLVWYSILDPGTWIFQAHYIDRNLWADRTSVSASTGGSVRFDAIFGTPLAGMHYYLLASMSGTTPGIPVDGITFPLNFDSLLEFTYTKANSSALSQTSVTLDSLGRAQSTVNLPAGLTGPAQVHFAGAVYDSTLGVFVAATNPVPLTVTP